MKIYISGKIGKEGPSKRNVEKFRKAEETLRETFKDISDLEVINPLSGTWQEKLTEKMGLYMKLFQRDVDRYRFFLIEDLWALMECDTIYMLEDFKKSPGALTEHQYAKACSIKMFYQDRLQAEKYLTEEMDELVKRGCPPSGYLDNDRFDAERIYIKNNIKRVWLPMTE